MDDRKRIVDLDLGDRIKEVFFIKEAEFRLRRDGKAVDGFLRISDSSGEIEAIYWDITRSKLKQLEKIQVAKIEGQVSKKRRDGQLQLTIRSIEEASGYLAEDFIPSAPVDIGELMKDIDNRIAATKNHYLKRLLLSFFDDKDLREKFQKAPAAKKLHQAYRGGLAEHTVNVCRICETICKIYPEINQDFLISTAILHDIGKIEEYSLNGVIDHTDEGKLIGHIVIGTEMVTEKIKQIKDFPEDLAIMFKHALLSHHGKFEFGSPKLPSILPAIALFYADDTDAKLNGIVSLKEQNKDIDKKWSERVWWLDRPIYMAEHNIIEESTEDLAE